MNPAIYLRVSTDKQTTENQEPEVVRLAAARVGEVRRERWFVETGSAAKHRPIFEEMMDNARRGTFDVLFVWSIDRFGRSMFQNLRDVVTLDRYGVTVVSVKESWLDTSDPMIRKLLISIFSWVAEHERERLRQRVRASHVRVKARGGRWGRRPTLTPQALAVAVGCRVDQHLSWAQIARQLVAEGFGEHKRTTIAEAVRVCQERSVKPAPETAGFPGPGDPAGKLS